MSAQPSRRIRVIYNPQSGMKAGLPTNRASADEIRGLMTRYGLGDELVATESEEDAVRAVREAARAGYDVVVAAGGDGTAGTVACEILDTATALAVLPLGSVMNIARMLEIPRDLEAATAIIAGGETHISDVGEAKGTIFF